MAKKPKRLKATTRRISGPGSRGKPGKLKFPEGMKRLPYVPGQGFTKAQLDAIRKDLARDPSSYWLSLRESPAPKKPRSRRRTNDPKEQLIPPGRGVTVKLPPPPKMPPRGGPRGAVAPPPRFPGWQSIAQSQIGPMYDPILGQYAQLIAARQAEYQAQAKAKQDAFRSFAEWYLKNAPGQIQGVYSHAAQNQSAFAKGFSDTMTIMQRDLAQGANKQIANAGGPAEQMIHVGPEAANAVYSMGGAIPSGMLNQQGAAFAAAAALQPPAIMAEGGRLAAEIEAAGAEDVAKLRLEEAELRAERSKAVFQRAEELRAAGQEAKADRLEALQKKADKLTDQTGFIWVVKGNKIVRTKARTLDSLKAESDASKPERISISLSESYGVLVDVNGQVVRGKNGKPIPYVPYQPPSKGGGGSSGGGGGSQSSNRYYFIQTDDGIYKVDKRTGKMVKVKSAPGGAAGGVATEPSKPLSPKDRAAAVAAVRQAIREGMTWGELVQDSAEWPIDQANALKIAAREYGGKIVNGSFLYTAAGLRALAKKGSGGFNAVRQTAINYGFKPTGKNSANDFINFILSRQGKGKAVPSGGGRENISFPLSTSPGGGSEFSYVDPEGAPDANGTRRHAAKDWFAPGGSPVFAPEGGVVVEVKPSRGNSGQVFGGVVKVQTADGRVWVFRHVDPRSVRYGQRVNPGQVLATVTRWASGSSHAHIELWRSLAGGYRYENMIDPMSFFGRSRSGNV